MCAARCEGGRGRKGCGSGWGGGTGVRGRGGWRICWCRGGGLCGRGGTVELKLLVDDELQGKGAFQ